MMYGSGTTKNIDCNHSNPKRNALWKKTGVWYLTNHVAEAVKVVQSAIYWEAVAYRIPMTLGDFKSIHFYEMDCVEFDKRIRFIIENDLYFICKMKDVDEIEKKLSFKYETSHGIGHNDISITQVIEDGNVVWSK